MIFRAFLIALLVPCAALAQSQEEADKSYLASLIEDNLSGAGREVSIIGFQGALSSQATIDVLTIADTEGVWLTIEDIVLDWNRSALLRGAIDVQELSAAHVVLSRAPVADPNAVSATLEAKPFALPELPVSIALGKLNIDLIELGDVFLGEPVSVSLSGTAALGDGEGTANIIANRIGGKAGAFEIKGSYANATRQLGLLLRLEEGADGIAARVLDLPGRPAVKLVVEGDAPVDDYAATVAIATDGQDRLNGDFALVNTADQQQIRLDVTGDISPLFLPEYQDFFGTDARLTARVVRSDTGRIDVPELELDAGRVALTGALQIGTQGWPERIDLTGGITPIGDDPVLLPLSGPKTYVDGAALAITYDAKVADDWRAEISVDGFDRPGLGIESLSLRGGGILKAGEGEAIGQITANLRYAADGVELDDAGAARAFGDRIEGVLSAARTEGAATQISQLTLSGAGVDVMVQGTVDGPKAGFATNATAKIDVAGLGRFSTLAGQDLGGAATLDVIANIGPLDRMFRVVVTGKTDDLSVGIPQADAVLAGVGDIAATLVRDTEGTRLEALRLRTPEATVTGTANLTSAGSRAQFNAALRDVAVVLPDVSGAATVAGQVTRSAEGQVAFTLQGVGPAVQFETTGSMDPAETGQTINADVTAEVSDLSRYASLAGRPLSGAGSLVANGVLLGDQMRFDVTVSGETRDVVTGIERLDPLLAGDGQFSVGVSRPSDDALLISDLSILTPGFIARGDVELRADGPTQADITARIADLGLLDPALSGPLVVSLSAEPEADGATATMIRLTGPGTLVAIDATVAAPADGYAVTGDVTASVADLAAFASLVGQPIAGSIDLTASGTVMPDLTQFDAQIKATSQDIQIRNPTIDPLIAGKGHVNATIALADGVLAVRTLEVSTPQVSIVGALNGNTGYGQGRFNASLRDVGVLTDQISGPVRATGSASLDEDGNWGIDANGTGPGGLIATIRGQVSQSGELNLAINGDAPLALANAALEPRRLSGTANFDIGVNGPPALSSLNGNVNFANGRLAAPTLGQALTNIGGQIRLGGSSAQIDLRADVASGGGVSVSGPVALTGGNQADVTVRLDNVVLQDPELYSTTVNGQISLRGPAQGGARIEGRLNLEKTDIQVPSSGVSALGDLPTVMHIGAQRDVRRTLARANVALSGGAETAATSAPRRAYPLNIVIDAPSRIFIRGRGLDAELGGRLTIGGTTANVIPVGQFSLERGRINILQQRFDLTEGSASLQGDFDPYIRLVASTQSTSGTTIRIIVEGPAASPEVRFESVPDLPQDEVLSQLIFGRDLQSISPLQAVQLAAAISTLAGNGGGALDSLRENIGLDDFDVTTDDDGNAAVRAGKYLSDNVYTDVTITSEGNTEINLNLDITSEITAKGSVDQDGETSLGVFFERDY